MAWFLSFYRHWTNNNGNPKTMRSCHRLAGSRQARSTIERLEDRTVPSTSALVNGGELVAPDTNVKSLYEMALDPTTGVGYWGTDTSTPGAIVKVDLTGPIPAIVSENTTGIGGRAGFTTGVVDSGNPDPSQHYLYVAQNHCIVKYSPGVGNQAPQPLARIAVPNNGGIWNGVIDDTTGYAYFGTQTGNQNYIVRLRLSDFTIQGVEWLVNMPHSGNLGLNAVIDTVHHIAYYSSDGLYPALEKVDLTTFTDGATSVGTTFDLGSKIDAIDPHYAGIMPNSYGANLIFDQVHDLLYFGTYSFDDSTGQVNNNVWPYNQATVVRIDPTGAGAGFASSVVSTMDLQPGERNLAVAGFDRADGDIIYATDNTYPMHVYRVHVGDGSQPMREIGSLRLNGGSQASFPDGTSHPEATPATQGEIFARSACFYNGNLFVGTDTPPGQFIKIEVTPNQTLTTASLSGQVYQDVNGNGQADAGEPGLAGRTAFIDLNANGTLDAGDPTAVTDASGNYTFANVAPGSYVVRVATLGGELQSLPAGSSMAVITNGSSVTGKNVGLVPTSSAVPITLQATGAFPAQGNPNRDYVEGLYRSIFNRNGDAGGIANWAGLLGSGALSRLGVVQALWNSQEHRVDEVNQFYQVFLGRAAEPQGLNSWVGQLESGVREETVAAAFLNSVEYLSRGDKIFVDAMYLKLLGRSFDLSGEANWLNLLGDNASGNPTQAAILSHAQVVNAFLFSTEELARLVDGYYSVYLNRQADGAGLNSWMQQVRSGLPFATIGQAFLAADEFFSEQAAHG